MRIVVALASALAWTSALADTVEATSTTYLSTGKQTRSGLPGESQDLVSVTPVIEVVTVSARDIKAPGFDSLEVIVSTWGSADLGDRRWDNGTNGNLTGDVTTGYIRGQLFDRHLTIRVGRENVAIGAGRVASIDGGDLSLRLPLGIVLSAYAGAPVSQRFSTRDALTSWNSLGGDLAYGGRAGVSYSFLDLGASAAFVDQGSQAVRRDVGADARIRLYRDLSVNGSVLYALEDERFAEISAVATWHATRNLFVTADYRNTAPDLLLSRTSILSVFSDSTRQEIGGGLRYDLTRELEGGVDYHALVEPGTDGTGTVLGHQVVARGDHASGSIRSGGELSWLQTSENKQAGVRVYARREFGRLFGAGDITAYYFDEAVNGQRYSAGVVATAGYKLAEAWTVSISAHAAVTPFMENQLDVMAKLAYNQTYRVKEVR